MLSPYHCILLQNNLEKEVSKEQYRWNKASHVLSAEVG